MTSADAVIAFVNSLAGPFLLLILFLLARLTIQHQWYRRLFWLFMTLQGGLILFFGYVEATSWALLIMVAYVYTALKVIRDGSALEWPALLLGVAVALHPSQLFLIPSWLALVLFKLRDSRSLADAARAVRAIAVLIAVPLLIVLVALLFPQTVRGSLIGDAAGGGDNRILVPLTAAQVSDSPVFGEPTYTLLSLAHLSEIVNVLIFVVPLLPWLIFAAILVPGARKVGRENTFMAAALLGAWLFLVFWNADLGMRYDFDLFASVPYLTALLLALRLFQTLPKTGTDMRDQESIGWSVALGTGALHLAALVISWTPALRFAP